MLHTLRGAVLDVVHRSIARCLLWEALFIVIAKFCDQNVDRCHEMANYQSTYNPKRPQGGQRAIEYLTGKVPRRPVGCAINFDKKIKEIYMKFHNL